MKLNSIVLCATLGIVIGMSAQGAAIPGQGTWETTLLGRDITGLAIESTDKCGSKPCRVQSRSA